MGAISSETERDQRAFARIGQTVCDKWRLDAVLGIGGIAVVYAATHRNGKRVAIKILHAEYSLLDEVRERFLEEGYVANRVGHPGVASVLDDGVTPDGAAFLVMDLLQGETLDQRFHRYGEPFVAEEVLCIADQVLDVLIAAHEAGIVHRDIKPENIFVTYGGEVKLLDFGIAHIEHSRRSRTTEVGFTMGTPAFMPPEQARGRQNLISGRTDLWALGATMFWLLSGRYVREAESLNEELLQAMTRSAPTLRTLPDMPEPVAELVDRALQFDVEDRFADARSMQARVREVYAAITGADHAHTVPPEVARSKAVAPLSGWRAHELSGASSAAPSPASDSQGHTTSAAATLSTHPPVARSTWPRSTRQTRLVGIAALCLSLLALSGFAVMRLLTHHRSYTAISTSAATVAGTPPANAAPTVHFEPARSDPAPRPPEPSPVEVVPEPPLKQADSAELRPPVKRYKLPAKRNTPPAPEPEPENPAKSPAESISDDPLSQRK